MEESQVEPAEQIGHLQLEEVQSIAKVGEHLIVVLRPENLLNGEEVRRIREIA